MDPQPLVSQKIRRAHLLYERKLEIKNNSIAVIFHQPMALISHAPPSPGVDNQTNKDQQNQQHNGYCYAYSYPYFQVFCHHHLPVLQQWLNSKILINVYNSFWVGSSPFTEQKINSNAFNVDACQILTIGKGCFQLQGNFLYFNHQAWDKLINGCQYFLAKNNATIQLLTRVLDGQAYVDDDIMSYIEDPNVNQIPSNQIFQLNEQWSFRGLNQSQKQAIRVCVRQKISFIKGPPGCGKTRLIARLCSIFALNGCKVMIGAVTNNANFAILSAILKQKTDLQLSDTFNVVIYVNKELYQENIKHSPEVRMSTFRYKIIEAFLTINQNAEMTRQVVEWQLDKFYKDEQVKKSFISVYYQAMFKVLNEANVVIVTTTSSIKFDAKLLPIYHYKPFIGILDQAAQASWGDTYCYLTRQVQKIVLIGDDKQLPPTVISQNEVLKQTIFTRISPKNSKYFVMLNKQYRMHPKIFEFPNRYFYENKLQNGVTAAMRMSEIAYFKQYPLSFISIPSKECEQVQPHSKKRNYWNEGQVIFIARILKMFPLNMLSSVGIISPYELQIRAIVYHLPLILGFNPFLYGLEARTCDGYQGKEKQYIIISTVRANQFGKIGFCGDQSRVNVMLTRAKKGLVLIGHFQTFWQSGKEKEDNQQQIQPANQKQIQNKQTSQQIRIEKNNQNLQMDTKTQKNEQIKTEQNESNQTEQKQNKGKNVWRSFLQHLCKNKLIITPQKFCAYQNNEFQTIDKLEYVQVYKKDKEQGNENMEVKEEIISQGTHSNTK